MGIVRQTDWLDGEWWKGADRLADVFNAVVTDPAIAGKCVICRAEQPDDVRWPAYSFELQHKVTGRLTEFEYRSCRTCEPILDQLLRQLGAEPPSDD